MARRRANQYSDEPLVGRLVDFSGGQNDAIHPALLNDNESKKLQCADLEQKGALKPCKGSANRYSSTFDSNPVIGLGALYKSDGTTRLVAAAGTKLFSDIPHLIKVFDTQADFVSGVTKCNIDTDSVPGSIKLAAKATDAFTRASVAYNDDGTQVASGTPRYKDLKKVYIEDAQVDFASGTLTQATATASGDLVLAQDGTNYSKAETTQADFVTGTLTNVVATSAGNLELLPSLPLQVQDDFSSFNSTIWALNGAAAYTSGYIRLTPAVNDVYGHLVYSKDVPPDNFVCEFDHWAGGGSGADGTLLIFGADSPSLIGIQNGYYIMIDEFQNPGDPSANNIHLVSILNGVGTKITAVSLPFDVDNSTRRRIRVESTNGRIKVYINETLYLDYTITNFNTTYKKFGFRALTGGLTNEHCIDNVSLWYGYASSGFRLSPVYDISPVDIAASSTISWNATLPANTSLTVETNLSFDGGTTWQGWQTCTSGGSIPGITKGTNISNAKIQVRQTLSTTNTTVTPQLHDLTISIVSAYKTSGNRVSSSVPVGLPASAQFSLISWTADTPAGTSMGIEISWDGGTTWAACTNGAALPGISGRSLINSSFRLRESLSTTDIAVTPKLSYLKVEITSNFGQAVWIEEGTTNLFPVDKAQSFTAAWTSGTLNGTYTVSIKAGTGKLVLSGGASGEVNVGGSLAFTVNNAAVTFTPSGGTPQLAQLEQKSYATSWITGGSTRSADNLNYTMSKPLPMRNAGCFWWKPTYKSDTLTRPIQLMAAFNTAATPEQRYSIEYSSGFSGKVFHFKKYVGAGFYDCNSLAVSFAGGATIFVAWLDDPIAGYMKLWYGINGAALTEVSLVNTVQITDAQKVYWGCYSSAGYECDGTIDAIQVIDIDALAVTGTAFDSTFVNNQYNATQAPTAGPAHLLLANFDNTITAADITGGVWVSPWQDVSQAVDQNSGTIFWESNLPVGTSLAMKTRSSADQVTTSAWAAATNGGLIASAYNTYLQIAAVLSRTDTNQNPELQKVTAAYDGTPAATELLIGLTAGGSMFMDTLLDTGIIVNGLDIPKKYDGVNTPTDLGGSPPRGEFIAVHKNRVFMLTKSRLQYSGLLNFDNWPVLNFIDIAPNDGDRGTGLIRTSDYLCITKNRSVHLLLGDSNDNFAVRRLQSSTGNVAPRSLCLVNELVAMAGTDGIYFTDFANTTLTSERMKTTWNGLNLRRLNQIASAFFNHKLYVAGPSKNSTINDTVIVFDTLRQAWSTIKGWYVACWLKFVEAGQEVLLYGDSRNGQVVEVERGYSFNGAGIEFEWESKHFDFGMPERLKRFRKVYLECTPALSDVTLYVSFIVDNGAPSAAIPVTIPGSNIEKVHTVRLLPSQVGVVQGHSLGFKITQNTPNAVVGIHSLSVEYFLKGARPTL